MANVPGRTTTQPVARRGSETPAVRPFESGGVFSPFALLREMTNLMDQVFERGDVPIRRGERMWAPAVEVRERDNDMVIDVDLPGIDQNDVKVEVDEGALVIQGERKLEKEEERQGIRRSERFYGAFFRAIPLPENAKLDQVKADFRNGVLEITVPVEQPQSRRRQIPLSGQSASSAVSGSQTSGSSSATSSRSSSGQQAQK